METLGAVLEGPGGPVTVRRIAIEGPGRREVLVRMEACGLCHSDLMIAGMEKLPLAPLILGHEGIGRVEALGDEVRELARGDRVGITFLASTCRECDLCASGRERYCARQVNTGYTRHGALAEYAVMPVQNLVPLPEETIPAMAAPLCCAGWTALSAIGQTGLHKGQMVALFGMGGLGHLGLQYAAARGLRVAVVDPDERKLEQARRLGAEIAAPRLRHKADAAVVFTAAPGAVEAAFRTLERNGTLVLVGLSRTAELPVFESILKGITVKGSYLGSREELRDVFQLAARGVGVPEIETHALAEAPAVLEKLRRGEVLGRAVIRL